jgi:N-glycosidase YbiA
METRMTNPLETVALFEEKVPITPRDLADERINIDGTLYEKITQKLEGKCSLHGWVVPKSLKVLSRSMGYVESGRFTGDVVFHLQVQGTVINPPAGAIVTGQVIRKNKMGMYVDYKNAIRIILPRDLHIGDEVYEGVAVGQYVECEIKKSRFQVNDEFILSVGDFRGVSKKMKTPKTVAQPPLVEEEEEVLEEENQVVQEDEEEQEGEQQQEEGEELVEEEEVEQLGGAVQQQQQPTTIEFSSKTPTYKEFSNFHKQKILLDGKEWPTVEHYFQAQKFQSNPQYQETIRAAKEPTKAKSLGASREHPIRNDWDSYREEVMKKALQAKFEQNKNLKDLLLSTENKALVEATNDSYWGQGRNKKGKNRLGFLLMELRDSLRAGK